MGRYKGTIGKSSPDKDAFEKGGRTPKPKRS